MTAPRDGGSPGPPPSEGGVRDPFDAGVDALHEALGGLRDEIRRRFPAPLVQPAASIDWAELLALLRRRLGTLGMSERSGEVDEFGMEQAALAQARPLFDLLYDRYWRVEAHDFERLPESGPFLLVANRSGLLPYDGLMISHAIYRYRGGVGETVRFLVADWLMTLPFAQPSLARLGGVRACRENAERLLENGHALIAFPEGAKGAAKRFRDRYRLQRFGRGGVVRLALEGRVPVVPVGVVGAEEAHPILFKWGAPARALGLPFLPVTPTFPLLGPFGLLPLPTKWVIRFGEPLPLDHLDAEAAGDELLVARLTEDLRTRIQTLVDTALRDRESVWG